jgi:hypothetical protein
MAAAANNENIQSAFLEQIRKLIPPHLSLADELAEVLNISRDSAYRRIRGETVLSLDEAKKLYDRYGISLDALFSEDSNMVHFFHRALTLEYPLSHWLNSVSRNLETISSFESSEMIFAAKDLPVFRYFRIPELTAFKLFFWLKCVIKDPQYVQKQFEPNVLPKEMIQTAVRAWEHYSKVPSIEIWSDEAINDMLKQIGFFQECGFFVNPGEAKLLCDHLIDVLHHARQQAADGKKASGCEYKLYENDILIADNTIMARMDKKRVVYINYNALNLLTTFQESFVEKTSAYLDNMIKNSTLISATAEKERNKFFNKLVRRIEDFKSKI